MKNSSQVIVRPARNVRGSVQLPGDKSISHRYAMLAGIAEGPSRLENYSTGADCASTLACMRSLSAMGVFYRGRSLKCRKRLVAGGSGKSVDCGNYSTCACCEAGLLRAEIHQREIGVSRCRDVR
jgi:3-phosphoshikimate 1-carboxyvinyltransferase